MMQAIVTHFEIPVSDMVRARAFYEHVFNTTLELQQVDGNEMAFFPSSQHPSGASGALACGSSYLPGAAGVRVYFLVADIDAVLASAVAAGGKVNYPVTAVPDYGWVAEFIDSEGNCIALSAYDRGESK